MTDIWENIYAAGDQLNRYPWDNVVSFLYRHASSQNLKLKDLTILEVGCGAANNLWAAAREGATVYGIDCSQTAIKYAKSRFNLEGLEGHFTCCFLPEIPDIADASVDCIIDHCCLTVCDDATILDTHRNLARVIKPSGKFMSTFYGTRHSSHLSGKPQPSGLTTDITEGSLDCVGPVAFFDQAKTEKIFAQSWNILELSNITKQRAIPADAMTHEEWQLVATAK